jgi:hypothetical protein
MLRHFEERNKACPTLKHDIELTPEIRQHILNFKVYHIKKKKMSDELVSAEIIRLKVEIAFLKNQKKEKFYQPIVEKWLGGTHQYLERGITDVSNDTIHAEIKNWNVYKEAMGQLTAYCQSEPKIKQAYMFGKVSAKCQLIAAKCLSEMGIEIFVFTNDDEKVEIREYETHRVVFTYMLHEVYSVR